MDKEKIIGWLVWSIEHDAWWMPSRRGYTQSLVEAGKYTFDEAKAIVWDANKHRTNTPNEAMVPLIESEEREVDRKVCGVELAIKLRDLGVPQKSMFWWLNECGEGCEETKWELIASREKDELDEETLPATVSAFTATELGEMLLKANAPFHVYRRKNGGWYSQWEKERGLVETEVDDRTKMLIFFIENKMVNLSTSTV